MVKLAYVRQTRLYGPRESRDIYEYINTILYAIAIILLVVGLILLLPGLNHFAAWILLIIAFCLIILVNLHDLYAQLAGFDFKLPLLTYDPQLALIEIAAPLVYTIGAILFLAGACLFMQIERKRYFPERIYREHDAMRLFIAGSVFWLLGSIHNAFQVFERAGLRVQALHKAVSIPFLIGTTLFLISSVLGYRSSHFYEQRKILHTSLTLAIIGGVLLLISAIINIIRVKELQEMEHHGGGSMEKLRGGAQERLEHERAGEAGRPFLGKRQADDPESQGYKEALIR